ncbi:MAG: ABC transporter ATP-binding protein/permease, partial [Oscillospiraceae bacterium]|nr:ABC transporter ATP-binding protein/permease [Oscillospiraceae bacterium]
MLRLIREHLRGKAVFGAILAPLCMIIEVFMDLQQPTLMSNIIDVGVSSGDLNFVLNTGLRMLIYAIIGIGGGAGSAIAANFAAFRMAERLRSRLFAHVFTLSAAEVDKLEPSGLITRLTSDVTQMQEMLVQLLRFMTRGPFMFIGGVIMAFALSPRLALILVVALPIVLVFVIVLINKAIPLYTRVQERLDAVNTAIRENLLGIRVVKSFALEERQAERFDGANTNFAETSIKAQKTTFLMTPINTLVMNLCVVAVLWFGGNMQINGSLRMGLIIAFVNYMVQITSSFMMLVNASMSIARARVSATRIITVFETAPSVRETKAPKEPKNADIAFDGVTFSYWGNEPVLRGVSLKIKQGQRVGIIGATGCGKSTLAALMARLYDPDSGSVTLGGVDLRDIPQERLREKVGIVFQESLLFSGSIAENLRFGDENADENALLAAAEAAQAGEFLGSLSGGFESEVAQRGRNFSGGQKQRLSIARSLLHNPEVLILDDSASALDAITDAKL